jgi:hypothetical protein
LLLLLLVSRLLLRVVGRRLLRLETILGADQLVEAMLKAAPGWMNERSWEFWRGRLALATGRAIPETPPLRTFE